MSDGRTRASLASRTPEHRRMKAQLRPVVEAGGATCWRCGKPIRPGAAWDLGHDDVDRRVYRGPEHQGCNRATNGRYPRDPEPVRRTRW